MPQIINVPGIGQLQFPDGMSQPEMAEAIQRNFPQIHSDKQSEPQQYNSGLEEHFGKIGSDIQQVNKESGNLFTGLGEGGLNLLSGLASSAAGGVAGLVRGGYSLAKGETFDEAAAKAGETSHAIQEAGTYQPRTGVGKLTADALAAPLVAAKDITYTAGKGYGMLADVARNGGLEGLTNDDLENGKGARIGGAIGSIIPDVAATVMGGRATMRAAGELAAREKAPVPGKDFTPLRDLSPEELARLKAQKEQGIEPTLSSVTRDPTQFRFEDQISKTQDGAALRERQLANEEALSQAVIDADNMRQGRGTAQNEREAGRIIASALEENAKDSLKNISELYKKADESGETRAVVDTTPLEQYFAKNRSESIAVPALQAMKNKFETLVDLNDGVLNIRDLENLYQAAGKLQSADGAASMFMREIKNKINDITEGAGGDLYRQARQARLEHALEYEDRGAISRLIDKKNGSRTDYKTASEDVFNKTVVNSSLAELQDVTTSLLSKDPVTSPKSWQAVREMQAQTVNYLLDKAIEKSTSSDQPTFSPTAYRNVLNRIGSDKIEYLLGPEALARLETTLKNAQDLKSSPGKVSGSDTALNLRDAAQRFAMDSAKTHLLSKIPGIGGITGALAKYFQDKAAQKALQEQVFDSLHPRKAAEKDIAAQAKQIKQNTSAQNRDMYRNTIKSFMPAALASTDQQRLPTQRRRIPAPFVPLQLQSPQQNTPILPLSANKPEDVAKTILGANSIDEAIRQAKLATGG